MYKWNPMSEWSHLPNAALIDWVIADVKENRSDWDDAWNAAWEVAWEAARDAAWNAACDAARDAARDEAWTAAWIAAMRAAGWYAARCARLSCLALVAYDHAVSLFDMPVEQVRVMAYLGQPAAVLLLTACLVREKRREMILT